MKIAIPSKENKLCAHFGNCESFTFVEVNENSNEITNIESIIPEGGVSCQCASWIAEQGTDIVLAGGMGGRPMQIFAQNGVKVIAGCPELPIEDITKAYLSNTLTVGENTCSGEHHHCNHHHHE